MTIYFIIFTFFFKCVIATFLPLFSDEAYYYIWSLHPQLSYFDHPGMVSWMLWPSSALGIKNNPLLLRLSFIILSTFSLLIWNQILKVGKITESTRLWVLVFISLHPLVGVGSVIATPDTPLVFFWSLSFWALTEILSSKKLIWYFILGISLGLGFCSKYHIVLFVPSGLIYILLNREFNKIRAMGVAVTLIAGLVFSLPVIIWNYNNSWISFKFQLNHGFGEDAFSWKWPLGYLVAQTLIAGPFVIWSLFKNGRKTIHGKFTLVQLFFFFYSSFKSVVEGNWPLTSHLHNAVQFSNFASKKTRWIQLIYWLAFYAIFFAAFHSPLEKHLKKNIYFSSDTTQLAHLADKYYPLYGPSYQIASLLTWELGKSIPKLHGMSRYDYWDTLSESLPTEKTFYVLRYSYSEWPENYKTYSKELVEKFPHLDMELHRFTHE